MSGEKTEKPTEKKKREARKEGQIARTPDLGSWGGLLVASMLLPMLVRNIMDTTEKLFVQCTAVISDPDPGKAMKLLVTGLTDGAMTVAPLAFAMMATAIIAAAAQGALRPSSKLLKPDVKRLNPFTGIKKTFGPQALWEAVKVTAKTAVLGTVLYLQLRTMLPGLVTAASMPLPALLKLIADAILALFRTAAAAGLVIAVADYAMSRRRTNKQLKMSKHEVKQEHKQQEGDPLLKGAIRSRQMAMSRQRMMSDLAKADVVLVNPTHVAVALRYDPSKGAPRVVAKGAGAIAARIREVAAEKRIPMVQDVPLARALYKACDLGSEIPPELYSAVARVLAFVMTLKTRGSAAGLHRAPALTN
ncbi:EscU/YscU/HrcU family type III secretion system export apparatus switch protein [Planosporangium flavigriseum]|uniref:Flagellar biosynthesis protein FlhB n=1 Tax=Planosporangium flavigriseum TaxID=373681 RepID=A0A8J3PNQ7_9ACTN|nr:EscU/YscU/HrcU family type III secretion system export apparatus switch protein [Planosporangium flavigriseum]NJC66378.1 EscU/YscU/HrcU family type III secretion system export apparatus switch protein [Planosporangium flavigriseum]GIG74216.1 flagellar biosynthesis protein FlhB [Planosporangium flavigriseum]